MNNNQYTNKKELIKEILILTCKQCGKQQSYSNKYSYRRAMGIGSDQTQKNKGLCGKCSRKAKRNWTNITQEYRDECSLRGHNRAYKTSFDTLMEFNTWYNDNVKGKSKYKTYRRSVENRSKKNLKLYNPEEYNKWFNNKWDGIDMNKLTIDHDKEIWECYSDNWTISQASHISNLVVMTMKENIEKHMNKNLSGS
ncbi:hypothetical protein H8D04_00025 [bacterium]|nr:hypothetical protein [bacterium]